MNTEIVMKVIPFSPAFAQEDCEQTLSWLWSVFPSQTLVMRSAWRGPFQTMASGSIWTTPEKFNFLGYRLRNRKRTLSIYQAKRQTRILSKCHCKRRVLFDVGQPF